MLQVGEAKEIGGIATSSKEVCEGDLFLALPGAHTHGSSFIEDALQRGACAVLAPKEVAALRGTHWHLAVDDVLLALHAAAGMRRRAFTGRVIAVTGSVGKTTAKEAIGAVLGNVPRSKGNYNSTLGLPLSVLSMPDAPFWVLELGINHVGEMAQMARTLLPDIGVLTNVGSAHIGELGGMESILREKTRLSHFVKPGGSFLLPHEILTKNRELLAPLCHIISFGEGDGCDFSAENIANSANGICCDLKTGNGSIIDLAWPVAGKAGRDALLVAGAVGVICGRSECEIRRGIKYAATRVPHRAVVERCGYLLINESYNASPEGMMAALEGFGYLSEGRVRVAVLGDMLELGEFSRSMHEKVGERVAKSGISMLFTYGAEAMHIANAARRLGMPAFCVICARDEAALLLAMRRLIPKGAAVLFKASRAMLLERVFEAFGGE